MVVAEVLPLGELVVEQLGVIDHDAVQQPVELLGVDPVTRSTFPFSRGVAGLM